jgi:hypothetical protein
MRTSENLDFLSCGGWGVFIALNHQVAVGEGCWRWAHRTVRCATGQVLFTVRCTSDSVVLTLRALFLCQRLLQPTVARVSRCSTGASDSPVNYSGVRLRKPESGWLDSVRSWCTGHCPVAHRTVRCARPQHTWFLLLL